MVPTRAVFWDISELCWLCSLVEASQKFCLFFFTQRETWLLSFCRWTRRSSSFLKHVCHVHPYNLKHTSRQTRLRLHGIFNIVYVQTSAWSHPSLAPQEMLLLALVLALMHEGEQNVLCLETIAFCWVFMQSSPPTSLARECMKASGNIRRHGESMVQSRRVGSNHLFQQQLLLKLAQNIHATTTTLTLLWYLLCGDGSTSEAMSLLAGHSPRGRSQRWTNSFTFLQGLKCGVWSSYLNISTLSVSIVYYTYGTAN